MNLFEAVKDAVPTRTAAEHYGIQVNHNGMACCPFHKDRTPSMKLDRRFHCFGCQADGDVIDFVGRLFSLSPRQAAEKLAQDFGIQYDGRRTWTNTKRPSVLAKLEAAREYQQKENRCFRALCSYYHMLCDWRERYAPKPQDADWNERLVESIQNTERVEYLLDELISGTEKEKASVVKFMEGSLDALEKRVTGFGAAAHGKPVRTCARVGEEL